MAWKEQLHEALVKEFGKDKGQIYSKKYADAFPNNYQDNLSPEIAIRDIVYLEGLSDSNPIDVKLCQIPQADIPVRVKLFQWGTSIPLSDILPILDHMDLRTLREHPYKITLPEGKECWISDFSVSFPKNTALQIEDIKPTFEEALKKILRGECENDGFNKLVLDAKLSWQDILILRSLSKYTHQARFRFSQHYIENTLANNPLIANNLVKLFKSKHDPALSADSQKTVETIEAEIKQNLEAVSNIDHDHILRHLWSLIRAIVRTNYFQTSPDGNRKKYLSFKFRSKEIPELPLPHPLYEIFVYGTHVEGIHLRSAKVARGGIRWSDRREDFRTEILGLMKAQTVKNSVIVPSGAKGGFVLKALPIGASREAMLAEGIRCYQDFIRGLLDITDNYQNDKVIRPTAVVCLDDEDPYLVVAADKGTATFSDIANGLSKDYQFWLGDAFASGGSVGYDHKKMGITARGAWESVKRHFLQCQIHFEKDEFTVVGIGDMSGDVFGNGMIYSSNIKLLAAFDHRHIFLDPNPDAKKSFAERTRLFNLPTSSWENYNPELISPGGGVFKRALKSIPLSPEIKKALAIEADALAPNELICAILKAPVDLLFNGGIGTYVKASTESHADVGDRTNEFCRVNGNELRCKVVGEGGNLGFTQLGRIEYSMKGGLMNTDFIDNSAGVDCSDHEVNIKILLNKEMQKGKLTEKDRNTLLASMTDEVAELVLKDNYNQALAMSIAASHSNRLIGLDQAYLKELEANGTVNRAVEFLPDDKKILERKAAGLGMTRPELAVLLSYTKLSIKNEILKSALPEDPFFDPMIFTAFPKTLVQAYADALKQHNLRREIIATQLSNDLVNMMGITFMYRMQDEAGASTSEVIRAHTIVSQIFDTHTLQKNIESLMFSVPMDLQQELFRHLRRLQHLATRWFLRSNRLQGNMADIIARYQAPIKQLEALLPSLMSGVTRTYLENLAEQFVKMGLDKNIAQRIASSRAMYTLLNVVEVALENKLDLVKTAQIYFDVGKQFNLVWFRDQINSDSREGHWDLLARFALREELDAHQRKLTVLIMQTIKEKLPAEKMISTWIDQHPLIKQRWDKILEMLHGSTSIDYVMFFISLRELTDLINIKA